MPMPKSQKQIPSRVARDFANFFAYLEDRYHATSGERCDVGADAAEGRLLTFICGPRGLNGCDNRTFRVCYLHFNFPEEGVLQEVDQSGMATFSFAHRSLFLSHCDPHQCI